MINVGIKFPNDGDFCNHDVIFNELTYIFPIQLSLTQNAYQSQYIFMAFPI